MIEFSSQNGFEINNEQSLVNWITDVISQEDLELGDLSFVFCSDDFLYQMNIDYLEHDTLTDIITFDYRVGSLINGEVYISTDRVADNAKDFEVSFKHELHRVVIHGVLHICGYGDLTKEEEKLMRSKEDWALSLLKEL